MTVMKRIDIFRICAAAAAFAAPFAAGAQNLDPTVSVTREYEAKLLDMDKPALSMFVPDSVTRFNLDFDYSVLNRPYRGAYEFTPFALDMKPEPDAYRERQLWVSAGAGYTLRPAFHLVWSPLLKGNFRMNVYADHDAYVGSYRSTGKLYNAGVKAGAWESDRDSEGRRITFDGYDLFTRIGTDGRYDWNGGSVSYNLAYLGIASKDTLCTRHYDALDFDARVRSVRDDYSYFFYDAALGFRYGVDNLGGFNSPVFTDFGSRVHETLLRLDTSFGPVIGGEHAVLIDVDANVVAYGRTLASHAANLVITPKYCYSTGRFNVKAGVRIDLMKCPDGENTILGTPMNRTKGQVVYPDVAMNFGIIEEAMDIYLKVGGGNNINPYSTAVENNHHFSAAWNSAGLPLLDNTVERVSAAAGLRGRIGSRFNYDVKGGWLLNGSAPLDAFRAGMPAMGFARWQCAFASLRVGLDTAPVDVNAYLDYKWTDVFEKGLEAFEPSRLNGGLSVVYNWNRRIFAGIRCDGAVNRRGYVRDGENLLETRIPWYLDLGLDAEYRFSRGVSLWLRAGNLMNQTIQRHPGYSEHGVSCTVGISFVL